MKWRSLDEAPVAVDHRPLREIFAERKELIAKYVPQQTRDIHARVVSELKSNNLARQVLPVGAKAALFELNDHNGKLISSNNLLTEGRLVICFIRGRWCPFCVGQMEAMNMIMPELQRAGASLIAISPQNVRQSFFMHDQHKLRFPLLSDASNGVARQFGLVYLVPEYQQAVYKRVFVNLPFVNGDESWALPIPATYVVERNGTVSRVWANEDYRERPEPLEIAQSLETLAC
jgi:peroxiredoxin